MDLTMVKLAVERLYTEMEQLKLKNAQLEEKVNALNEGMSERTTVPIVEEKKEDELIDTKQVLKYLGICYNTLQSIIRDGLIKPIRINQRRIRYSRLAIQNYIKGLQSKSTE